MERRPLISTTAALHAFPVRGSRVHVSDASPHGYLGHVTGVYREALAITRDTGARELVTLSRRRVRVVDQ
jgi:hypothetical protein